MAKYLILGGVKSGKSRRAEQLATAYAEPVHYIATAQALDTGMEERIRRHRLDRPSDWTTTEEPLALARALEGLRDAPVVLIDCLTLWVTNLLMQDAPDAMRREQDAFINAVRDFRGNLIMVSNETNMGVMPMGALTRAYCDEVGVLHQALAQTCEHVELVVAGLPMTLKSPNANSGEHT